MSKRRGESRTVWTAVAANGVIFVAKTAAGLITGSAALLAEAAHSLADTCNQGLVLLSLSRSARKPDEEHPFGYGKERFFWVLVAAIFVFVAGAAFSIGEGISRILFPGGEQGALWIPYAVLGAALIAESASLLRAVHQTRAQARESRLPFFEFTRTSKEPAVKMVLAEDGAAVAGVVIALVGTALHQATGAPLWDGAAAVAIGLLLALVGYGLGRNMKALLIGASARPDERERLSRRILEHDGVDDLVELLTMYVGAHALIVAARIDLRDDLTGAEVERLSEEIDRALRDELDDVTDVFLDATPRSESRRGRRAVAT